MSKIQIVRQYYALIDALDIDSMLSLFSENAEYVRFSRVLNGMTALKNFYQQARSIHGTHSLESVDEIGKKVIVVGSFNGKDKENNEVALRFADFFEFNDLGKIVRRQSFSSRDVV